MQQRTDKPHTRQWSLPPLDIPTLNAGLFITATPIGNLSDISLRALQILHAADVIACEDTRVSKTLLQHYGIPTPMISYHEHNAALQRPKLLSRMQAGESVALISDAGTPLISDPGYKLVLEAREQGIPITAIPGASSVITALSIAGLPTDRFTFVGFLPVKESAAMSFIASVKTLDSTLVMFESARRLPERLSWLLTQLGDRPASIARELTKQFEEVRHGTLSSLYTHYQEHGAPKGELVIVIGSGEKKHISNVELEAMLKQALQDHSFKEAVAMVTTLSGLSKKLVYAKALSLKSTE